MSSVLRDLIAVSEAQGGAFVILIDPDRLPEEDLPTHIEACQAAAVDAFFLGSSILYHPNFDRYAACVRAVSSVPVIGFPGSLSQLSGHLDAILFLSVVSSRNPEYLIGQQVHAAPVVKALGVEPIPTAYMLIESGATTAAQYVSHSMPLPRSKPDLAAATALAAEMLGMELLFTDAGSGAELCVPREIIQEIRAVCSRPLLVGGGLRAPADVESAISAGAQLVVVGNALERRADRGYLEELAAAAHSAAPRIA